MAMTAMGLSIVEMIRREGNGLIVNGVEIIDGTPLFDIKRYTGRFDRVENTRNGWHDGVDERVAGRRGERRS
jgi:tRNA (Thr-GGU) A37 N-methylase